MKKGGAAGGGPALGRSISQDLMAQMRAAERGEVNHRGPAIGPVPNLPPGQAHLTEGMKLDEERNVMVPDDVFVRALRGDGTFPEMPPVKQQSEFRGVTKHRRSGRWEAHIWFRNKKRQLYLGGYEKEEHAAEAYDLASIKIRGENAPTNFDPERYQSFRGLVEKLPLQQLIQVLRKQSQESTPRQTSSFRGVVWYNGGWVARTPAAEGHRPVPIGMFPTQEQAARAHDRYVVLTQGRHGTLNYTIKDYDPELMMFHERQVRSLEVGQEGGKGGKGGKNPAKRARS